MWYILKIDHKLKTYKEYKSGIYNLTGINGDKEWWLNDQKYGSDTRFNIQSWLHLQKILLF